MLGIWYDWVYKRSLTKPILKMIGTYEITVNGRVINATLSGDVKKFHEAVLTRQALGYIEYAEKLGAELIPIAMNKKRIRNTQIFFKLKFKNNAKRSEFEKFVTSG